jgi:hypothetical protein
MSEYPWDFENMMLAQHDQPCDCAICDEIHRAREARKSRGAKCFLNNDGTSDCDRLRAALQKIARGTLEPGHVYQQAVMMQDIAREALADRP